MKLAIIPARGGSKRIPRKNIKDFQGMPIIGYAILAACDAGFDDVMVSTDDAEIANVARQFGASVPFMRSSANSGDHIGTVPVLLEVLECYSKKYKVSFSDICCIYPCNPFLTTKKLQHGLDRHIKSKAESTFPVVRYSYPPQRGLMFFNTEFQMIWPENYHARSQDLQAIYHDTGQFYWLNVEALSKQKKLFMAKSTPLIYPETEVQDIDTLEDWTLAEVKYQLWRNTQFSSSEQAPKAQAGP